MIDIPADSSLRVFRLPEPTNLSTPAYFVDLRLSGADGRPISSNFYWLSAKDDVLDNANTTWFYTPNKEFADFTTLKQLSPVTIQARDGSVQTSYFASKTFAANRVERIDVAAGQFVHEIAKVVTPFIGSNLCGCVLGSA